jgi:hypothetical protein
VIVLDGKEAKEIIRAGFAWANWTDEQKEAFKLAYDAIDKAERNEKALKDVAANYGRISPLGLLEIVQKALKS